MATQATQVSQVSQVSRRGEITAGLIREIAAVEDEYRAALQEAARDLQPTKAGAAAIEGGVASGPLVQLGAEAEMTIHSLEARLDQLKEIQQWAKVDPHLLRFVERLLERSAGSVAPTAAQAPARRSPAALLGVGALALLAGWALWLAIPATILLGR